MKDILIEISTQGLVEMHEYIETGPIYALPKLKKN